MNTRRSSKLIPWRVGRRNPLNVYKGTHGAEKDRSICQTHRPEDAQLIVAAVNQLIEQRKCERCHGSGDIVPTDGPPGPPPAPRDCPVCPECDGSGLRVGSEGDTLGEPKFRYDSQRRMMTRCQSDDDGDCVWGGCPQLRDGEPAKSGRHCPLDGDREADR